MKNLDDFEKNLLLKFGLKSDQGRMIFFEYIVGDYNFNFEEKSFDELLKMMDSDRVVLLDGKRNISLERSYENHCDVLLIKVGTDGQNDEYLIKSAIIYDNGIANVNSNRNTSYSLSRISILTMNSDESAVYTEVKYDGNNGIYDILSKYYNTETLKFLGDKKYDIKIYPRLDSLGIYCDDKINVKTSQVSILRSISECEKELNDKTYLKMRG